MILVDLNHITYSTILSQLDKQTKEVVVETDLLRHMILNTIRANRKKFNREFGELVICCDGRRCWRKGVFKYYKSRRSKSRKESVIDWNTLFNSVAIIEDELREFFPYRVIKVPEAEADDIIGVLCWNATPLTKHLILSSDNDFIQLHANPSVDIKQFNPIRKVWVEHNKPEEYLKEHIIRGDSGDDVPNIFSPDETFAIGRRQTTITAKKLEELLPLDEEHLKNVVNEDVFRNFKRNQTMIDLRRTPDFVKNEILEQYKSQAGKDRKKLFNFFASRQLNNLMGSIGDF